MENGSDRRDRRSRRDYERDRERDRGQEEGRGPKHEDDDRDRSSSSRAGVSRPPESRSRSPEGEKKDEDKSKPNFKNSGLLAAATNTVKRADGTSTVLKYNEPPEARRPTVKWRLYVFKGKEESGARFYFNA